MSSRSSARHTSSAWSAGCPAEPAPGHRGNDALAGNADSIAGGRLDGNASGLKACARRVAVIPAPPGAGRTLRGGSVFRRIAVVNRGEAAMRLINAVRELNAEGGEPIETVALYTDGERTATFVREADIAYPLGPASARPYIDLVVLERGLRETKADAAWVGWGFVAEDPAFAELCERL